MFRFGKYYVCKRCKESNCTASIEPENPDDDAHNTDAFTHTTNQRTRLPHAQICLKEKNGDEFRGN